MSRNTIGRIKVAGDFAARDMYKDCDVHQHMPQVSRIAILLRRLAEGDHGEKVEGWLKDLAEFTLPAKDETVLGVRPKLEAAGKSDRDIERAEAFKERVFAQIMAMQYSETYQRICIELIGDIFHRFEMHVKPAIDKGADAAAVARLVHEHIVSPVHDRVERCGVDNDITFNTIMGMLYLLTGNCHVKWVP